MPASVPVEPLAVLALLVPLDDEPTTLELVPLAEEADEPLDPEAPDDEPEEFV